MGFHNGGKNGKNKFESVQLQIAKMDLETKINNLKTLLRKSYEELSVINFKLKIPYQNS